MLKYLAARLIGIYQLYLRTLLPRGCRFTPSCSEYARRAILKYGVSRGGLKALQRIACCHPFSSRSGDDPLL